MPDGETQWQPLVGGPLPFPIGPSIYGQMVFEDPDWNWRTFNYDVDLAAAQVKLRDVMDALDPDLRPFKNRGGKLIGGRTATEEFARLFLLPGMGHCRGGTGPDTFERLTPLVDWVERGVARNGSRRRRSWLGKRCARGEGAEPTMHRSHQVVRPEGRMR